MRTVVLLGTEHSVQRGKIAPESFELLLIEQCKTNQVNAIAEEIIEGESTIALNIAKDFNYKYLYADPGSEERKKKGIPVDIEMDVINKYREKYPEIAIWPSVPNEETLPREVWEEYHGRVEASYRAREYIWLEKIQEFNQWPLFFICGADHFGEFSKLMRANEIQVIESHKHWMPI
jgi:hypothetical protein